MSLSKRTGGQGFEVIGTVDELYGRPGLPFVPAIRVPAGMDLIFVAGALGSPDGDDDADDIHSETHRMFKRIGRVLEAAGATFSDVVQVQKILVNIERDNAAVVEVMREYFETMPTSMTCEVPRLVPDDLRIEVSAIAAVPARAR